MPSYGLIDLFIVLQCKCFTYLWLSVFLHLLQWMTIPSFIYIVKLTAFRYKILVAGNFRRSKIKAKKCKEGGKELQIEKTEKRFPEES